MNEELVLLESNNEIQYYPYYTPYEMSNMGVYNENCNKYSIIKDDAIDWYHEYTDNLTNTDSENWYKELQFRYESYKNDSSLDNKQLILNLGWNPEVVPTLENILVASELTKKRINEKSNLYDVIEESMIFDKRDNVFNIDKWENGDSNILLITGLSGSGKTTSGVNLANTFNAKLIQLDIFQNYEYSVVNNINEKYAIYPYITEYLKKNPKIANKTHEFSSIKLESFKQYFVPFFKWLIDKLEKDKKNRYVVEGIHILLFVPYSSIKEYPLYCINTSVTKSLIRHWIRDNWGVNDIIKHGYKNIELFKTWDCKYDEFKDSVHESMIFSKNDIY